MARSLRDSRLETRSHRLRLEKGKPHWLKLDEGLSLVYRRNAQGVGTWSVRLTDKSGRREMKAIGVADDYQDANGVTILTFAQAQAKCLTRAAKPVGSELTVGQAAEHYLVWFKEHRKSYCDTDITIRAHILPTFGDRRIGDLTAPEIRRWHEKIATLPPRRRTTIGQVQQYGEKPRDDEEKRSRKASANRILTVLKAILNKAYHDQMVADNAAWRSVKPFRAVDEPVVRFLMVAECTRLINACSPGFRELVQGALFTGCRYGELVRLKTTDVNLDTGAVYVRASKSGKGRHVPLSSEGVNFFAGLVAGKLGDEPVFTKQNAMPWGRSHQSRPLQEACEKAKIAPAVGFHELRHTYASLLAQAGADLLTISKLLGHADTRITSRHYAHLCDKTLANTVRNLLPDFGHKPDSNIAAFR